jgi:hypothetical protein
MSNDRTTHAPAPAARQPRFNLGRIVATPGALRLLAQHQINPLSLIARHVTGDFGELCTDDLRENERAIEEGLRVFSSYVLPNTDEKVWCITEWDRSITTLLRPSEY